MRPALLLLSIFFILRAPGYCQENTGSKSSVIMPFRPAEKRDSELKIQKQMPVVENFDFSPYVAVALNDISFCSSQKCRSLAGNLLDIRYMAEGRCDDCFRPDLKKMCAALKSGNCNELKGRFKSTCEILISQNATADSLLPFADKGSTRHDMLELLGMYYGFKNYSVAACIRYFGSEKMVSFPGAFMCQVVFSADPQEQVRKIIRDLAIFNVARKENDLSYCDMISDVKVKNYCKNPSIRSLDEIR